MTSKPSVEKLESDSADDDVIPLMSWYNHFKRNQSVIVDLFHGQFRSQITCPDCNRVLITYDPFMSVSVPIPEKAEESKEASPEKKLESVKIQDCFKQFEKPEQLAEDNKWYCNICKKHQRAFKKMEIYKAPPILIVHFKRFRSGGGQNSGKIEIPIYFPTNELDISAFVKNHELPMDYPMKMPPRTKEEQKLMEKGTENIILGNRRVLKQDNLHYDLFGVVNHFGKTGFGHYTAYAKNWRKNQWYCFDDSTVKEQNEKDVCTPAAYVLFYKRRDWEFNPS